MRPALFVPDSKPVDELLSRDAGRRASTSRSSSTSTAAPPAWSRSRTCSRRSSARSPTSTTPSEVEVEQLADGAVRVSSRYPIDDLDELFGVDVEDEDVDTVGGLMAKHLGRVPIPGSPVEAHGLRFEAEEAAGRRNKIGTVLITPASTPERGAPTIECADSTMPETCPPRTRSSSPWPAPPVPGPAPPRAPRSATPTAAPTPPRPSTCRRCSCPRSRRASPWRWHRVVRARRRGRAGGVRVLADLTEQCSATARRRRRRRPLGDPRGAIAATITV